MNRHDVNYVVAVRACQPHKRRNVREQFPPRPRRFVGDDKLSDTPRSRSAQYRLHEIVRRRRDHFGSKHSRQIQIPPHACFVLVRQVPRRLDIESNPRRPQAGGQFTGPPNQRFRIPAGFDGDQNPVASQGLDPFRRRRVGSLCSPAGSYPPSPRFLFKPV